MSANRRYARRRLLCADRWFGIMGALAKGLRIVMAKLGRLVWLGGLLGGLAFVGADAAYNSPYFLIRTVDLTPTEHMSQKAILDTMGLNEPVNIFEFNILGAEESLLGNPWVAEASVEKFLPDRVTVTIDERKPAAVVALSSLYLADESGRPFTGLQRGEARELPVISGLTRYAFEQDPDQAQKRVREALALHRLYIDSPVSQLEPLNSVQVMPNGGFELMLGRIRVDMGWAGYRSKLDRVAAILMKARHRRVGIAYILLDEQGDRAIVKEIPKRGESPSTLSMKISGVGTDG